MLERVFASLNENVNYVVLRNYHGLPKSWGNDIDILVDPVDLEKAIQIISIELERENWILKEVLCRFELYCLVYEKDTHRVQFDLFSGLNKGWIRYAWCHEVLKNKVLYENIPVPNIHYELALIAIKDLMTYGKCREKYRLYFKELSELNSFSLPEKLFETLISDGSCRRVSAVILGRKNRAMILPSFANLLSPIRFCLWFKRRFSSWNEQ